MPDTTSTAGEPKAPALSDRIREFLAEQGFRPWVDDDFPGSVWFRHEGLKFLVRSCEGDDDYVQFALGFVLREESRDELTLLRAMNREQAETKVVKVYVSPECDLVEFQMELFLDGRMPSPSLLERLLFTLRGASRDFFARVRPEEPKAKA